MISYSNSIYANFLNFYQPSKHEWTECFVLLDLRVSSNFARISEQLFKTKFQANFHVGNYQLFAIGNGRLLTVIKYVLKSFVIFAFW